MFSKHPKGLPVLFFTEMWERFGFYLMLGIFTLYMIAPDGKGFTATFSTDIYGTYLALVYLTPFLGGLLADRFLGYRKSIFIGGTLMGLGYLGLAVPGNDMIFYLSLLSIIVGNGFFKPNISTLVGRLYDNEKYAAHKDSGYNIFYMGINIGAFICNFFAAFLRNNYGWSSAFALAGIGMFVGLAWFFMGQKHVKEVDFITPAKPEDTSISKIMYIIFVPAAIAGIIGWFLPTLVFGTTFFSESTDAFMFACLPLLYYYFSIWKNGDKKEREQLGALYAVFLAGGVFFMILHQNGSAMTLWANDYTSREMPAVVQGPLGELGFAETVTSEFQEVTKVDGHGTPVLDAEGKPIITEGPHPYLNNLPKEEWPKEGESISLLNTEIFQSANPGFVIILTPLIVVLWTFLARRKKEPSTPGKIVLGVVVTALSMLIMVGAVMVGGNGASKVSALWIISMYGVLTFGELCLSPMGLSLVSKLAPPRFTALLMGGWFMATAIGNKASGVLSGMFITIENKAVYFLINGALAAAVALLLFVMLKWLKRVVKEHTGGH
ncbi:MAG: peptide MFS transporter [Melioribacteraceae bacterium]|nr:peptide MFS transporter [Melioribacteraceae bacterium]